MIPVVLAEVHLVVYSINRGIDNWSAITKFMGIVLTIIDSYWPHYVELRLELPVGVVNEIVMHTARKDFAVKAGVAFFIKHVVDYRGIIRTREFLVVELHQNDQPPEVIQIRGTTAGQRATLLLLHLLLQLDHLILHGRSLVLPDIGKESLLTGRTLQGIVCYLCSRLQLFVFQLCIDIVASAVLHHRIAVLGSRKAHPLVTMKLNGDIRPVGLLHLDGLGICRYCLYGYRHQHGNNYQKNLFHLYIVLSLLSVFACKDTNKRGQYKINSKLFFHAAYPPPSIYRFIPSDSKKGERFCLFHYGAQKQEID